MSSVASSFAALALADPSWRGPSWCGPALAETAAGTQPDHELDQETTEDPERWDPRELAEGDGLVEGLWASLSPRPPSHAERAHALARTVTNGRELLRQRQQRRQGERAPTSLTALDELLAPNPRTSAAPHALDRAAPASPNTPRSRAATVARQHARPEPGGFPRGQLTELVGRASCGRFATVLTTLARLTQGGEVAALVDLGDHLDPRAAASFGIDVNRLLWVRPTHLRQALAAAEVVLQGGFPLVALDLGLPPIAGGRGVEAGWVRLARVAAQQNAVVLVSSPYRVSGTAARVVLIAHGTGARWRVTNPEAKATGAPQTLVGLGANIELDKERDMASDATARSRHARLDLVASEAIELAPATGATALGATAPGAAAPNVPLTASPEQPPADGARPVVVPHRGVGPASATARRGWRAQAPRALTALTSRGNPAALGASGNRQLPGPVVSAGATPDSSASLSSPPR